MGKQVGRAQANQSPMYSASQQVQPAAGTPNAALSSLQHLHQLSAEEGARFSLMAKDQMPPDSLRAL